jgi:hypothetical protein
MPVWGFRLAYAIGVAWLLAFEIWAAWFNKQHGDTLTEQIRLILVHPLSPLWWVAAGLMCWAAMHLLFFK